MVVFERFPEFTTTLVAMNFSLNGIGDKRTEFTEMDLFERETFSQDLDDIGTIIDALQKGEISDNHSNMNTDIIGLIGHSRGGHTAISAAVEYAPVQCLVTWSAVADYRERWTDKMKKDWEEQGYTEIENSRTGQKMKVGKVVYEDSVENADRVIAMERVKELRIPTSSFMVGKMSRCLTPILNSCILHARPATKNYGWLQTERIPMGPHILLKTRISLNL